MNKMLKKLLVFVISFFAFTVGVNAATLSATFSLHNTSGGSISSVEKGKTFDVYLDIGASVGGASADQGKVFFVGGYLEYDPAYIEFQSASNISSTGWSSKSFNQNNKKFYFGDSDLATGLKNTAVGKFTFKALQTGSTSINARNGDASDSDTNISIDVNYTAKSISITDPAPVLSSNSKLASLSVEGFTLSPAFNANTKSYTVTVPRDTTSVKIVATVADTGKATLTGDGTKTLSGESTTFPIKVTAENGTSTTYNVVVKKEAEQQPEQPVETPKSNDATLKKLDVSGYSLSPAFSSTETTYEMTVGNNVTGLDVNAVPNHDKAKVAISGNKSWKVGNNIIKVKVTAEDGTTTNTYTVTVTRQAKDVKSSDKNLDFKIVSQHVIKPEYSNSLNEFDVTVPFDVENLEMKITPYDKKTKVSVKGDKGLKVGVINPVTITVTAEDGSRRTITLNVTRDKEKANTDLLDIKVKDHTLNPKFKPTTYEYKVDVKHNEKKLDITVKAPKGTKYEIEGNENFEVGKNTVLIKVTDKNDYVNYYKIEVNKAAKGAFLGIGFIPFLLILLLLLLLLIILWLLLRKKKQPKPVVQATPETPVNIDFKPQFNFNSNNGTDDDVIYSEGNLVNGTDVQRLPEHTKDVEGEVYDIYDDVVTKDELYDAINEGIETKNPEKLKLLLAQEKLNRKKEALKEKEERTRRLK